MSLSADRPSFPKLLLFLLAALTFAGPARLAAADFASLKPQGYVSDFANVVDPASKKDLEDYAASLEKATGAQIALVTLKSLEGEPIEEVANVLFRKWGVGQKGKNEGLLFLLAIDDHRSRLEVGYGLEPIIPDGFAGMVLDNMRPALRQSQYGAAMKAAAAQIGQRIADAKGVKITPLPQAPGPPLPAQNDSDSGFPIWVWVVILIVVIMMFRSGRGGGGFFPGYVLGNILGSGSRGWGRGSGGGFGGYDSGSGGGFGGFGGGDSGGGGASSNW